jgi:glycosyltransferase involved in cell wall biosynthesis
MTQTILFAGHDFKFVRHLVNHFHQHPDWLVLEDTYSGHVIKDSARSEALLEQSDVVFCEWSLGNAEWYSHHVRPEQQLIVRLHSQEMRLPFLDQIRWSSVDALVFICPLHQESFLGRFPEMSDRSSLIYNLIDCDDLDRPKHDDADYTLGFMGTAPMAKAPHHAIDLITRLRSMDDRYRMRIKGRHPWEYDWLWRRDVERGYYEDLYARIEALPEATVIFDPHGDDVAQWFQDVGFILSTSDHEGSHQAVAEGMAAGSIPIIRNWAGSDGLYPPEHIFSTLDEAERMIIQYRDRDLQGTRAAMKAYASRFHRQLNIEQFERLIA